MKNENILAINGGPAIYPSGLKRGKVFGEIEKQSVLEVMNNGIISRAGTGEMVKKFEQAFANYHNINFAIATSSGTTALHTAVSALEIGPGDEVIVPDLTFISTASVILQNGAKAVFCDVDKDSFNISIDDLQRKINNNTKAIMVVHLYGLPANMDTICTIAKTHNLYIIEDCAQAHGANINDKLVGTFGDIGCFSFYQTKNMSCGEGGMVITNNESLYHRCRSIASHGLIDEQLSKYNYNILGFNYALTEIQSAVGLVQLNKLKSLNNQRKENAYRYRKQLNDLPLRFQLSEDGHVNHCLTGLLPEEFIGRRDWFLDAVRAEGAMINCLYPLAISNTILFSDTSEKPINSNYLAANLFNLYTNPDVTIHFIDICCLAINKVIQTMARGES